MICMQVGKTRWRACDKLERWVEMIDPSSWKLWLAGGGLALLAYMLASVGVSAIRRYAEHRQLLDIPNERSSHTRPVPRGGGLAIVIVALAITLATGLITQEWNVPALVLTLVAWALVAGISLVDDVRSLPNSLRFGVQAIAATMVLMAHGHWSRLETPLLGELTVGLAGGALAFLWLAGLTNAYNFMDGIDGIAGSQAVVAGIVWALSGVMVGSILLAVVGLTLAASSLGFLRHNWPPARIFMGDVGSAFLGLSLASLAVAGTNVDPRLAFVGILAVWPFIFDASFTFIRRVLRKENVFAAHRSHLYQRLVIMGYSHNRVTLLYATLAAAGGTLAVTWLAGLRWTPVLVAVLLPLACFGLWYYVVARERERKIVIGNRT
jgi:UDP-N-acetylmuramyl pentapeptide phosphotransferase/UDP-N-acetylglucosamine-1-phosphate transferase